MDDSFHKQLADQMRRTLDEYQAPYQPGAWETFERNRQPARPSGWAGFRYAAAACLLAGLLVTPLWLEDAGVPLADIQSPAKIASIGAAPLSCQPVPFPPAPLISSSTNARSPTLKPRLRDGGDSLIDRFPPTAPAILPPVSPYSVLAGRGQPVGSGSSFTRSHFSGFPVETLSPVFPHGAETTPLSPGEDNAIGARPSSIHPVAPSMPLSVSEALAQQATPDAEAVPAHKRIVIWSLALSPQTAYVPNGHSALSMGAGLISDVALRGRLGLTTGLSVARQTVSLSPPVYRVLTTTGPARQRTGTDARLMLVDLPLNLTYRVGPAARPSLRISAGLSSLALVSQRYTDTYLTTQTEVVQVLDSGGRPTLMMQTTSTNEVEVRPAGAFSGIYWGRLLNLSISIERPLTQRMVLAVEPYLKYPLGTLTQEKLPIGSAGVHLRIGFRQ